MLRIDLRKQGRGARIVGGAVGASLVLYLVIVVLAKTGHLESIGRAWGGDGEVVAQLRSGPAGPRAVPFGEEPAIAAKRSKGPRRERGAATRPTDARSPETAIEPAEPKAKPKPPPAGTPAPVAPAPSGNNSEAPPPAPTDPIVTLPIEVPQLPEVPLEPPPLPPLPPTPPLPVTPPELPAPPALPLP